MFYYLKTYKIKVNMKFLIFMSDNRTLNNNFNNADYNSLTSSINYEYSQKHGYDFIYYRPYLNKENTIFNCKNTITNCLRHAAWSKILSTSLAFELPFDLSFDYIVYIDSDCIFKDFDQKLEEFITPYEDKDIIFLNNKPWNSDMPCSGFYICKINEKTKEFFRMWYNINLPKKDYEHPWEQDALWDLILHYEYDVDIHIIDGLMFKENKEQFLRHIGSNEKNNRIPYFKSFIKTKNIDHEKNIVKIKVIEYNTEEYINKNLDIYKDTYKDINKNININKINININNKKIQNLILDDEEIFFENIFLN